LEKREPHLAKAAMHTTSIVQAASLTLASGVTIPDSKMAREVTELVRDTENTLLFNHSSCVYYFSAATGKRKGLTFDPELLYVSAMFHDMGLTPKHSSATDRFEVDGANTAREFLRQHKIPQQDIDTVWTSIALHTTPGIPQYMDPVVAHKLLQCHSRFAVQGLRDLQRLLRGRSIEAECFRDRQT
jgi:hypothetical protein